MIIKRISQSFTMVEKSWIGRTIISILTLLLGWGCMVFLTDSKEIAGEKVLEDNFVLVEALQVSPKKYPVNIVGYGIVKPILSMRVASEISGKVVFVNPKLREGEHLFSGEILFKVNDADYLLTMCEAEANIEQLYNLIEKLKIKKAIDTSRICTLEKGKAIALYEFKQTKKLFEESDVGTKFNVNHFEKLYNSACDCLDQLVKTVSLYPIEIDEVKNRLKAAEARLLLAKTNLERCQIMVPFSSRVKSSSIEVGELISKGQEVAVLVDDSLLEIEVFLDSNEVKQWLRFKTEVENILQPTLFGKLEPVVCEIVWGGTDCNYKWNGFLNRITGLDQKSRMIKVVVQIDASVLSREEKSMPLVDGMFCTVNIPGRTMENIYRLPSQAVSFGNEVYVVDKKSCLKTVPVSVIRAEGEYVFINKGLNPSDIIVKTRLVDPPEGVLIKIDGEISRETKD